MSLKVLPSQSVVDAPCPRIEIGKDFTDQPEHFEGRPVAVGMGGGAVESIVATIPSVGNQFSRGIDVPVEKSFRSCHGKIGYYNERQTPMSTFSDDLNGSVDQHHSCFVVPLDAKIRRGLHGFPRTAEK